MVKRVGSAGFLQHVEATAAGLGNGALTVGAEDAQEIVDAVGLDVNLDERDVHGVSLHIDCTEKDGRPPDGWRPALRIPERPHGGMADGGRSGTADGRDRRLAKRGIRSDQKSKLSMLSLVNT